MSTNQVAPDDPPDYTTNSESKFAGFVSQNMLNEGSSSYDMETGKKTSKWSPIKTALGLAREEKPSKWSSVRGALGISGDTLIPEIMSAQNVFWVGFWVLAYAGLSGVFVYQMATLVTEFLEYEVDTQISVVRSTRASFPSVTVCNANPVRKSLISKVSKYEVLGELDSYVTGVMYNTLAQDLGLNYSQAGCSEEETKCGDSQQCVKRSWVCNDRIDCSNGYDEGLYTPIPLDCSTYQNNITRQYEAYNNDSYCILGLVRCSQDEPICAVPCDNVTECSDGFDESTTLNCTQYTTCGGSLTATSSDQTFTSANYPTSNYEKNTDCTWIIEADTPTDIVEVTISSNFDIETSSDGYCNYDYLQFRNGDKSTDSAFRFSGVNRLCGKTAPTGAIKSSGRHMWIRFFADYSVQHTGFEITYKSSTPSSRARRDLTDQILAIAPNNDEKQFNQPPFNKKDKKMRNRFKRETVSQRPLKGSFQHLLDRQPRQVDGSDSDSSPSYSSSGWAPSPSSGTGSYQSYSYYHYGDISYDSGFWSNYDTWYSNFDPYENFDDNMTEYDWQAVYEQSTALDYSDFGPFALFEDVELEFFGTQAEDFIAQCTFDGRECYPSSFQRVPNSKYGNCYAFNSIYSSEFGTEFYDSGLYYNLRNTSKTGKEYGLKLTLFLDKEEYIGVLSQSSGAHVLINAPYVPPLPEKDSLVASTGGATLIAVKQEVINRKGGKYGDCLDSWPDFVALDTNYTNQWPRYDQRACEHYCIEAEKFYKCGCVTDYYEGAPLCSPWDKDARTCQVNVDKAYRNEEFTCPCGPACNDEFYSKEPTVAPWPNIQYTPYLIERLRKYASSDKIISYLEGILSNENATTADLAAKIQLDFVRIEIYFQNLNFEKIQEQPRYTLTQLITDFGGNIGLWIGWSVLTFLEIVVFLVNMAKLSIWGYV